MGKQYGDGVAFLDGHLEVVHLVYQTEDPNCCASRGELHAQLIPGNGTLEVGRVWRDEAGAD
jgi:hypothetical protein